MRAYSDQLRLAEPKFLDYFSEFDSPWSVTMQTIWPNFIVQRELNTLGVRQIVPRGPNEFLMVWTMFGYDGDSDGDDPVDAAIRATRDNVFARHGLAP